MYKELELAFSIGISASEFWEMTPYELSVAVRGFYKKKEREAEEFKAKMQCMRSLAVEHALLLSRWVWKKRISKQEIEEALNIDKKLTKKNMTDEEMLAMVKVLNTMFGGEVRTDGAEK